MKISKDEKAKVRKRIVESAVHIIGKKGYQETTMSEIAKHAKIADATIYKYFPSKERLLFAHSQIRLEEVLERLKSIEDFNTYTLQEQIHTLIETELEVLEKDRAFVKNSVNMVFLSGATTMFRETRESKDLFLAMVQDMIDAAVEADEIQPPPFKSFLLELLWDFNVGILYYWIQDDSKNYANTTQLIDKSLSLMVESLKAAIFAKAIDLVQFFVRQHLLARVTAPKGERNFDLEVFKRQFMKGAENV
ncbi:MAG: TetR/AcrR family transcriptional regulator [Bdellovibrionia bacterium]